MPVVSNGSAPDDENIEPGAPVGNQRGVNWVGHLWGVLWGHLGGVFQGKKVILSPGKEFLENSENLLTNRRRCGKVNQQNTNKRKMLVNF